MTNAHSVAMVAALKGLVDAGHVIESVDFLSGHVALRLAVTVPDTRMDTVWRAYCQNRSKIEAIKEYRALFGTGLADSKTAVEALIAERGMRF